MRRTSFLPILLLAFAALPAGSSQGVLVDLKVVGLTGAGPYWTFGEPTDAELQVTIQNRGSLPTAYTVTYEWISDGVSRPLNEDAEHSLDTSHGAPPANGETRVHRLPWRLQPGQMGAGAIHVRVQAAAGAPQDSDPGNNGATFPWFVPSRAASISIPGSPRAIAPGETLFFRPTLANSGNVAVHIDLTVNTTRPEYNPRLVTSLEQTSFDLAPSTTTQTLLWVEYDATQGDFSEFSSTIALDGPTSFDHRLSAETPTLTASSTGFGAGYAYRVEGSAQPRFVDPEGSLDVPLQLRNIGTQPDSYEIDVAPSTGWSAVLAPAEAALDPSQAAGFVVHIEEGGLPPGSDGFVDVRVTSAHAAAGAPLRIPLRVSGPFVQLTALSLATAPFYLDDLLTARVEVSNGGNMASGAASHVDWIVTFNGGTTFEASTDVGGLAAGARRTLTLLIPAAIPGPFDVEATWAGGDESVAPDPVRITSFIREAGVILEAPEALAGAPGEGIAYQVPPHAFRVRNTGNALETFGVFLNADDGYATSVQGDEMTLAPGESRIIPILHVLPSPAPQASDDLVLRVFVAQRPLLYWEEDVSTTIDDDSPPIVAFTAPPAIQWTAGQAYNVSVAAQDDGGIYEVRVAVTHPNGTRTNQAATLDEANGTYYAVVWLNETGQYRFAVEAMDESGNVGAAPPLEVNVRARPPPTLAVLSPAAGSSVAASDSLELSVADEAGVARVTVRGAFRSDGTPLEVVVSNPGPHVSVPFSSWRTGPQSILVTATNAVGGETIVRWDFVLVGPAPSSTTAASNTTGAGEPLASPRVTVSAPAAAFAPAVVATVAAIVLWRRFPNA